MEITVTPELEAYVARKVASGKYSSASEVVVAGLESLRTKEQDIDQWLIEEVLPALDELEADPSLGIPVDIAFAEIREQHALRVKTRA
jgi:antitoxin ParD1/3/4